MDIERIENDMLRASAANDVNLLRACLEAGARVDAVGGDGWTGLMGAAANGCEEALKVLLEAGADPNKGDISGWTAAMRAAWFGKTESLRILLKNGVDTTAMDDLGRTLLLWAAYSKNHDCLSMVLEGASSEDLMKKDKKGMSAVGLALSRGDNVGADMIMSYGIALKEKERFEKEARVPERGTIGKRI